MLLTILISRYVGHGGLEVGAYAVCGPTLAAAALAFRPESLGGPGARGIPSDNPDGTFPLPTPPTTLVGFPDAVRVASLVPPAVPSQDDVFR